MRFEAWEGGCTRIASQSKSDVELLEELYRRVPESQKGPGDSNKWCLYRDAIGGVTLEVLPRDNCL